MLSRPRPRVEVIETPQVLEEEVVPLAAGILAAGGETVGDGKKGLSYGVVKDGTSPRNRRFLMQVMKVIASLAGLAICVISLWIILYGNKGRIHTGNDFYSIGLVTLGLRLYLALFGLSVLFLEAKSWLPEHSELRHWFYNEFHFLAGPRGKGLYYLLLSYLLFLNNNIWLVLCGAVVFAVACIYLLASCMAKQSVKESFGVSPSMFRTATHRKKKTVQISPNNILHEIEALSPSNYQPYGLVPSSELDTDRALEPNSGLEPRGMDRFGLDRSGLDRSFPGGDATRSISIDQTSAANRTPAVALGSRLSPPVPALSVREEPRVPLPVFDPVAPHPASAQPHYSQSHYSQPSYSQPSYSQPSYSQPSYSQPSYSQPTYSQPAYSPPAQQWPPTGTTTGHHRATTPEIIQIPARILRQGGSSSNHGGSIHQTDHRLTSDQGLQSEPRLSAQTDHLMSYADCLR
ncbi:COPI associated protein [Gregarina niphandrodes]|uniref:COPI associated protein n=1 Tax=Gregarina niphandrodes TaxID=110365 RepID=A0A023B839_GRENI|nr:COPI associated protein [Gregarina niphandrodes]EZG68115.1 COPI associated protein [Gregarina niphandrodes]|eukprot:XP_011130100.1 COPI associated protein [Gregarina niphandrodes]